MRGYRQSICRDKHIATTHIYENPQPRQRIGFGYHYRGFGSIQCRLGLAGDLIDAPGVMRMALLELGRSRGLEFPLNKKNGQTIRSDRNVSLKTVVVSMGRRNTQLRPTFIENKS